MPLDCLTVAVSVNGDPCVSVVAEAASVVVVETTAAFTWIEIVFEVDEFRPVVPEYVAVIRLAPTGRFETDSVAAPPESKADPIAEEPL